MFQKVTNDPLDILDVQFFYNVHSGPASIDGCSDPSWRFLK